MKINRISQFSFSRHYDLITVGPHANRIAKTVAKHCKTSVSVLTVEEENQLIQPSLMLTGSTSIKVRQHNSEFSDIQMGVGVQQISPNSSQLILKNGTKYSYKNLVYSGNCTDWKDEETVPIESQRTKDSYSFIYDDLDYQNVSELFALRSGSVVFTVPKDVHFGCQNYFMMLLQSKMREQKQECSYELEPIQITVVCQGDSLVPFNRPYNELLLGYLNANGIRVVKNADYSINYRKKLMQVSSLKSSLKFNSLFHYLPIKTPEVLSRSKINPFENNRHTLNNSKYQNIYILGNIVNNVYSLSSIEAMSRVIAQNVLNSIHQTKRKALYDGYSDVNIWLNANECHYIETDYNGTRLRKNIGQSAVLRKIVAYNQKKITQQRVFEMINSGCGHFSIFNQPQEIDINRFQVPVVAGVF